jgi:hypothetical protein
VAQLQPVWVIFGKHGWVSSGACRRSIRLKQIREGLEDYEYLTILAQRRSRAVAEEIVKKIARSWHDWDTDARHLLHARAEIARLILAK